MYQNREHLKLNSNKGFTLIELMISLSLFSLVLMTISGMVTTGNRFLVRGDNKADIQSNLRISMDYISEQIRYASNVEILNSIPEDMTSSTENYIYAVDGVLKHYNGSVIRDVPGRLNAVSSFPLFSDKNANAVQVKISGSFREQTYEVETTTYMLNRGSMPLLPATGPVICFSPGLPADTNITAIPVTGITIRTEPVGVTTSIANGEVLFVADILPSDASVKSVKWHFTSPVINATIQSASPTTGLLKFTNANIGDKVFVYAVSTDGSDIASNVIQITVVDGTYIEPTSVEISSEYDLIFMRSSYLQMYAKVLPENASSKSVTWSIIKEDGARISINRYTGLLHTRLLNSSGENITVTATLANGITDTKTIRVVPNFTLVKIAEQSKTKSGNTYHVRVRCSLYSDLFSGAHDATLENGVTEIKWFISGRHRCEITDQIINSDGTVNLTVKVNSPGLIDPYFTIWASVTPTYGLTLASNTITVQLK